MIDWAGLQSEVLSNPALEKQIGENELRDHLPAHVWFTTSGTTRRARRWVGLSKAALLVSAAAANRHLQVSEDDRWLLALPDFHVGGVGILARAYLAKNPVIHYSGDWQPDSFTKMCESQKITLTSLVPTQVYDLVRANLSAPSSLRAAVIGGGALNAELYQQARKLGWPILPSFGMTECSSQIATANLQSLNESFLPQLEILNHVSCRMDEDGRLELKSEALLTTYAEWQETGWDFFDPKIDGWFKSEDRAQIDGGFLKPLGRISQQTKVLGELVDLARLEESLQAHLTQMKLPMTATLIAQPHPRLQTQIDLVASTQSADAFTLAQKLKLVFDQTVLPFERSQNLYIVDKIPQTPLGKVVRLELLDQLGF